MYIVFLSPAKKYYNLARVLLGSGPEGDDVLYNTGIFSVRTCVRTCMHPPLPGSCMHDATQNGMSNSSVFTHSRL